MADSEMEHIDKHSGGVYRVTIKTLYLISTFKNYDNEVSGRKSNTVRDKKLYEKARKSRYVKIRRGYTKKSFTRVIRDVTLWEKICIISWG